MNTLLGRRDFMCRMSRLTGAAITTSFIPVSAFAGTTVENCRVEPAGATLIDEALGNYPSYSCNIGYGGLYTDEPAAGYDLDTQLVF